MSVLIKTKKLLFVPLIIIAIVLTIFSFINFGVEDIEDTNGPNNYSLQTIKNSNIVNLDIGATNVVISNDSITNMTKISSKKFSGVYEVLYVNLLGESDFLLNIYDFKLNSGNFKMVVVHDGKIVKIITKENCDEIFLEDINGTVSLVIAGESADFSFKMSTFDYEQFSH